MSLSFKYVVKSGDTLVAIAARFGFQSWKELYNHPLNTAFKLKRPNPDKIYVGDELNIPVTFEVSTSILRLAPADAFFSTRRRNQEPVLRHTKRHPPQFEWVATVGVTPAGGDFEVGFIQNLLESRVEYVYGSSRTDPQPKRVVFSTPTRPILDTLERHNRVWTKDQFSFLSKSQTAVGVATDDNPGGFGLLIHEDDPTKLLILVKEKLDLVTWVAARDPKASRIDQSGYEFLKHVRWRIERETQVDSRAQRAIMQQRFLSPLTKLSAINGRGTIPNAPVLVGPKAGTARRRRNIG